MNCPHCGHEQPAASECARCGTLVEKYKPRPARAASSGSAAVAGRSPGADPVAAAPRSRQYPATSGSSNSSPTAWLPPRPPSLARRAQFFQQLGRLAGAGLPLDEALATVLPLAGGGALQAAIEAVRVDLHAGVALPVAMARHPLAFDEVEVALVEAGTHTGELVRVCAHLHDRLQAAAEVRASVLAALRYPLFVAVSSCVLMPAPLLFTDGVAAFLIAAGLRLALIAAVVAVVLVAGPAWLAKPTVRGRLLAFAARVPGLGRAMTHRRLALALDVLARSVRVGVRLPMALELAGKSTGEPAVAHAASQARAALQAGRPLSQALAALPGLTREGLALVAAGEKSGHLAESLQEQADAWLAAWRRDLKLGGTLVRVGVTMVILLSVAWSLVEQFQNVLGGDPLAMVPGAEGEELRRELGRAMKQLPKDLE